MSAQSRFLKQTFYEQTITIGTLKMAKKRLSERSVANVFAKFQVRNIFNKNKLEQEPADGFEPTTC
jgi:hypothetical protein